MNRFSTSLADFEDMYFHFDSLRSYLMSSCSLDFSLYCHRLESSNRIQDFCSAESDQLAPHYE